MCLVLLAVEKWKRPGLQAQELSLLWHAELSLLCKGKLRLAKIRPDSDIFEPIIVKVFEWSPTTCTVKQPFCRAGALPSRAVSSTVLAGTQVSWCQCFDLLQTCCLSWRDVGKCVKGHAGFLLKPVALPQGWICPEIALCIWARHSQVAVYKCKIMR